MGTSKKSGQQQVYAVLRIERDVPNPDQAVVVKMILPSLDEARDEVMRLNRQAKASSTEYTWQTTRFLPRGLHDAAPELPDDSGVVESMYDIEGQRLLDDTESTGDK